MGDESLYLRELTHSSKQTSLVRPQEIPGFYWDWKRS